MNEQNTSDTTPRLQANAGRRRFLGKGALVAPAVLTLASQPALGVTCFTPSRSLSKNTSASQVGKTGECLNAESPGNYKTQSTAGTAPYNWPISPSTPFHSNVTKRIDGVNVVGIFSGSKYGNLSLLKVLNQVGTTSFPFPGDPQNVAFHLIGAYLNKLGGNGAVIPDNVMTLQGIKDIWTAWNTNGQYEVSAGIYWNGTQLVQYLTSNGLVK